MNLYSRFGDVHWTYPHKAFYVENAFDAFVVHIWYIKYSYQKV